MQRYSSALAIEADFGLRRVGNADYSSTVLLTLPTKVRSWFHHQCRWHQCSPQIAEGCVCNWMCGFSFSCITIHSPDCSFWTFLMAAVVCLYDCTLVLRIYIAQGVVPFLKSYHMCASCLYHPFKRILSCIENWVLIE